MAGRPKRLEASLNARLTRREREILAVLADDLTVTEIAEKLMVAPSSVKTHLKHLYSKLSVNSKRQALSRARELGLLGSGAPAEPTATGAPPALKHNLPLQATRFFGREIELIQINESLAENRLVTLTGPGGVGKTRLLLRAAEAVLDDYTHGVWLVELAPLADPVLVAPQLAHVLGLATDAGRPVLDTLTLFLRDRQTLLLLDNCEHLRLACAELAGRLLRDCTRLRVLATSREPLGLAGEAVFPVAPLPVPLAGQASSQARISGYAAVRLFVDRARLVLPDYELDEHNAVWLAHICRKLDGIPLAIEMAAARVNVLAAEQMAQRLDDAMQLLTGGTRSALPRQQTLRATIDWSYELLSPAERLLLQRLSVFAGGGTLEAAEAVCAGEGLPTGEVLNTLAALVDKSMVIAVRPHDRPVNYWLLETVRQYARDKLVEAGAQAHLRARHLDFFLKFALNEVREADLEAYHQHRRSVEANLDNMRQAVEWSLSERTEAAAGLRLLLASIHDLYSLEERLDWCRRGIALAESEASVPATVLIELLMMSRGYVVVDDPPAALAMTKRAIELARQLRPAQPRLLLDGLCNLTDLYLSTLDDEAAGRACLAEAKALWQRYSANGQSQWPMVYEAWFCRQEYELAFRLGQYQVAKAFALESLRLEEVLGSRWNIKCSYIIAGTACMELAEYDQARDHLLAALDKTEPESGDSEQSLQGALLRWLGEVELRRGGGESLERALALCQQGLRLAGKVFDRNVIATGLGLAAAIAAKQGQLARAARLAGASQGLYARQRRKPVEDSSPDTLLPGWRSGPEQAAIAAAFEAGQTMAAEAAVAYALNEAAE